MSANQIAPIAYAFDVSEIDPFVGGGAPLPSGTYPMQIVGMEVKANSGNTGHNLALIYEVIDGELKGRKLFDNLNLWFKNPADAKKEAQVVEIANKHLSSIGHAVGVTQGQDLTVLAFKPMAVEVELIKQAARQNPNTGEELPARETNRIVRRDPLSAQSPTPTPQFQQQQQAQQAAAAPAFNPAAPQAQAAAAPAVSAPPFAAPAQAATAAPAAPQASAAAAPPPWQK